MTEEPSPKRPKIRLACQECRDRKIRCDGGRPTCGSCIRKRLTPDRCVYADATAVDASSDYVRSLESRIRDLEHRSPQTNRSLHPIYPANAETTQHTSSGGVHPVSLQYRPTENATQPPQSVPGQPQAHDARLSTVLEPPIGWRLTADYPATTPSDETRDSASASTRWSHGAPLPPAPLSGRRPAGTLPIGLSMDRRASAGDIANVPERSAMGLDGFVEQGQGTHDGTSVYLGRSSAAAFLSEVRSKFLKRHRGREHDGGPSGDSPSSTSRSGRTLSRKMEMEVADLMQQLVLPPRRVADTLLGYYWRYFWPFNPILHKKTFQKRYDEIWTQNGLTAPSPGYSNNDMEDVDFIRAFYALFNTLIALGSLYTREGSTGISPLDQSKGNAFFERAENLMSQKANGNDNLVSVQVHILMAQYLQTTGKVNKCWVAVGTAIRIAQGIGIHLCPSSESQAHLQERRRTWSYCIQMDRILGMMFGRQPMVAWSSADSASALADDDLLSMEPYTANNPVSRVEDSILGFFVYSDKYSEILLDVLKAMYTHLQSQSKDVALGRFQPKDYWEILRLDQTINSWRAELPENLKVEPDADFTSSTVRASQATATLCRYLHLKMLLFRPAAVEFARSKSFPGTNRGSEQEIMSELQRSLILGCARSCLSAAQDMVKVMHKRCRSGGPLPNWWYSTFYVFTASTVILSMMTSRHAALIHSDTSDPLETSWKQAMGVFSLYEQDGVPFARQCAWTLQTALEQSRRDTSSDSRESNSNASAEDRGVNELQPGAADAGGAAGLPSNDIHPDGDVNLADAVLGEYWWHTAGLQWLENIDVPDEFVASEPMNIEHFDHAST